ncbi:DUF3489 domain-containing protein [Altererythrobacter buctensis]|uniref:DUF3489 domain-containing protein n=2 Tax=Alteraurantiacibacter buctensis TaxID=1503981 RepID=A0A844YXZ4_9SPHN|nr:DUF3489 domain-containing protein [Alteraurantiacibacter buctensis]
MQTLGFALCLVFGPHIPLDFWRTASIGAVIASRPMHEAAALTGATGRALGGGSSELSLLPQGDPPMTDTNEAAVVTKPVTKRPRRMARDPMIATADRLAAPVPTKRASKSDLVLGLLQRPEGATIDQLVAATGWLPHTTRAALTGLRKKGHSVTSEKVEGQRHYRIVYGAS